MCFKPAIDGATHPRCRTRYSLDGLTSFFHYRGIIRNAIKKLKYRFVTDLAQEFINLIPQKLIKVTIQQCNNEAMLVPIPLHPSRLRFRGFNQAEVLGKIVAQKLDIPMKTDILVRMKKTLPQVEMKERKKRLENMQDVFSINSQSTITNYQSRIILFDDVTTTGATLRSAANTLKRAGVKFVCGVVMAHG